MKMKSVAVFVCWMLGCCLVTTAFAKKEDYTVLIFNLVSVAHDDAATAQDAQKKAAKEQYEKNPYFYAYQTKQSDKKKKKEAPVPEEQLPEGTLVKQDVRIVSGEFTVSAQGFDDALSERRAIRSYKKQLSQTGDKQWKIAVPSVEVSPEYTQQLIQEILRQLNAKEEAEHSIYEEVEISGWKVRIMEDLLYDKKLQKDALRELGKQLRKIRDRVPMRAVRQLQKVPIWIYKDRPGVDPGITAYYTSLYRAVIFHNAKKLDNLSDIQNAVVLHEMAHGYHDIVLGYDQPDILAAYENALQTGLYRNVKTQYGQIAPEAYALTDDKEYFAELTESYFSTKIGSFENDYYPFNRYDLKKYDRMGYDLAQEMWGE